MDISEEEECCATFELKVNGSADLPAPDKLKGIFSLVESADNKTLYKNTHNWYFYIDGANLINNKGWRVMAIPIISYFIVTTIVLFKQTQNIISI